MTADVAGRAEALREADELLMAGRLAEAGAAVDALLETLDTGDSTELDLVVFKAALLVRGALCQYLSGAEHEADEMLGYLDRQLSVAVRHERDPSRQAVLAEVQDNARFYRQRLVDASKGAGLELPVALCPHGRQVPLLPCGFLGEHP